jgi:hypothetical protein
MMTTTAAAVVAAELHVVVFVALVMVLTALAILSTSGRGQTYAAPE